MEPSTCESYCPSCPVCLELFSCSFAQRFPRILPCGHTFCSECLGDLMKVSALILCPQCRNVHVPSPEYGLKSFSKNYALLELLGNSVEGGWGDGQCQSGRSSCSQSTESISGVAVPSELGRTTFSMSTSVQHLTTAIRNLSTGDILDLKGMRVVGDGPLFIDTPTTLKNAMLEVRVVINASSVALHNVNVYLQQTQSPSDKGDLVHIQGNNCQLYNCELKVVDATAQYTAVSLSRGSVFIMATTFINCHTGIRVTGAPVEIRRCNMKVEQYAIVGKSCSILLESCNLQGKCCLALSGGSSSLARESSFVGSGDSSVSISGIGTNLRMERCRMQSASVAAVKVENEAQLKMEHCEVGGNPEDAAKMMQHNNQSASELVCSAVMGRSGATIHLINCSVCKVPYGIVGINANTTIKLECCNIVTTLSHLFIERGAYVFATHSNFMDALGSGAIFVAYQGSKVELERCKIHQAFWHLLHAIQGAEIHASQCDIWGTQQNAVSAWNYPTKVVVQQSRLGGSGQAVVVPCKGASICLKSSDVWGLASSCQIPGLVQESCNLH